MENLMGNQDYELQKLFLQNQGLEHQYQKKKKNLKWKSQEQNEEKQKNHNQYQEMSNLKIKM